MQVRIQFQLVVVELTGCPLNCCREHLGYVGRPLFLSESGPPQPRPPRPVTQCRGTGHPVPAPSLSASSLFRVIQGARLSARAPCRRPHLAVVGARTPGPRRSSSSSAFFRSLSGRRFSQPRPCLTGRISCRCRGHGTPVPAATAPHRVFARPGPLISFVNRAKPSNVAHPSAALCRCMRGTRANNTSATATTPHRGIHYAPVARSRPNAPWLAPPGGSAPQCNSSRRRPHPPSWRRHARDTPGPAPTPGFHRSVPLATVRSAGGSSQFNPAVNSLGTQEKKVSERPGATLCTPYMPHPPLHPEYTQTRIRRTLS